MTTVSWRRLLYFSLVAFGAFGLWIGAVLQWHGWASTGWPSTLGEVKQIEIGVDHGSAGFYAPVYWPEYVYRYSVDGQSFENMTYRFGNGAATYPPSFGSEAEAHAHGALTNPVGAPIRVYYDPNQPERSVLKPGGSIINIMVMMILGIGPMVAGLVGLWNHGKRPAIETATIQE